MWQIHLHLSPRDMAIQSKKNSAKNGIRGFFCGLLHDFNPPTSRALLIRYHRYPEMVDAMPESSGGGVVQIGKKNAQRYGEKKNEQRVPKKI